MDRTERRHWLRRVAVLGVIGALVLGGCGGDDSDEATSTSDTEDGTDSQDTGASDDGAVTDGQDTAADGQAAASGGDAMGELCGTLAGLDLAAAFAGELTFEDVGERSENACTVPVAEAEGEGLIVQVVGAEVYDLKVDQAEQADREVQEPDLGRAAILAGNGDLTILVDDSTSLLVQFSGVFAGEPVPDDVLRAGLVEIAEQLLDVV